MPAATALLPEETATRCAFGGEAVTISRSWHQLWPPLRCRHLRADETEVQLGLVGPPLPMSASERHFWRERLQHSMKAASCRSARTDCRFAEGVADWFRAASQQDESTVLNCELAEPSPRRNTMRYVRCMLLTLACSLLAVAGSVPREAPSLSLKTSGGSTVTLESLRGKVVAVLWISTDCPHCQETCETFGPIYEEFSKDGLEILGMAVNQNAPGHIDDFKKEHKVAFPIGVSNRSDWMRFADLSVMARTYVPYMMIVDRNGTIRYEHTGRDQEFWADQETRFRKEVGELLAERPSAAR